MSYQSDIASMRSHIRAFSVGSKQYWQDERGFLAHLPIHKDVHGQRAEILNGLRQQQKMISFKYFYDVEGSHLFEQITRQPEYYLTRSEDALLKTHSERICQELGENHAWVELGSGSSRKTRHLLGYWCNRIARPHYMPVDISRAALVRAVPELLDSNQTLWVTALHADYKGTFDLMHSRPTGLPISFLFLGSNIGNFSATERGHFFSQVVSALGKGSTFALGVDLAKDPALIEAAYNDQAGFTARFNRNILHHLKKALNAEIDPDQFEHRAVYVESESRVEMSLVSRRRQTLRFGPEEIVCEAGETIHTEDSIKFHIPALSSELAAAGLQVIDIIKDNENLFSFWICSSASAPARIPIKEPARHP